MELERVQSVEERGAWLRQVSAAVERKSTLSRTATKHSFKFYDVSEKAPREYICPVSLELMRDPVLLVETGQVYDRSSIEGWFKAGKSTCPVSGAKVKQMRLSPIFPLRSAIQAYAKEQGIELDMADGTADFDDSPVAESPLSGTLFEGVSMYDVRGLIQLVAADDVEQEITALRLLADMSRFGDLCQRTKINRLVSRDKIIGIFKRSEVEKLKVQSARLLLHLPGKHFDLGQQIKLLKYNDLMLSEEVLLKLWEYAYRHRSKMFELASLVDKHGKEELVAACKKIANPTENTDYPEEVRSYSTFLLACAAYRKGTRRVLVDQEITPLLVNQLHSTSNLGFRFCLMKALQYMSEDKEGRLQVLRAGGVRIFVTHLPPRNKTIHYTTRIYVDWFAWVTVAETAVKALYFLAFEDHGRSEMRTTATMKALRIMVGNNSFPDNSRSRYLLPLLARLSTVPS